MFKSWLSGHRKSILTQQRTGRRWAPCRSLHHETWGLGGDGRMRQRPRTQRSLTYWEVLVLKIPGSHKGYTVHGQFYFRNLTWAAERRVHWGGDGAGPEAKSWAGGILAIHGASKGHPVFSGEAVDVWKTTAFSKNDAKIPFTLYPLVVGEFSRCISAKPSALGSGPGPWACICVQRLEMLCDFTTFPINEWPDQDHCMAAQCTPIDPSSRTSLSGPGELEVLRASQHAE